MFRRPLAPVPLFLFLLAAGCRSPVDEVPPRGRLVYFAQITDTHQGPWVHSKRYEEAVRQINGTSFPLLCVLHTGDHMCNGFKDPEQTSAISNRLARFTVPLLTVPGNHDIPVKRPQPSLDLYRRYIGPLATRFETNGVVFLALYTEPLRGHKIDTGDYDPAAWLTKELDASGDKPVIVATHTPDGLDYYRGGEQPGWPEECREKWLRALRHGNVVAILCGHYHRDELHWNELGIPTYVCSSVAGFWGRQGSYRIYEFDPRTRRLGYRTFYIEDPPPDPPETDGKPSE